jgi:diguanylate cyclase (GGDEF)-like protein
LLSTARATRADTRLTLIVVGLSTALFAVAVPFAKVALAPSPAFIAAYQSALVINDAITAVLLFAQFSLVRARSLLVLASGYLFASLVAILHALTFPGLFTATGLLGAGMQTTAWLYMAWHAAFPLAVVAYAALRRGERTRAPALSVPTFLGVAVSGVIALLILVAVLTIAGDPLLPTLMAQDRYTPLVWWSVLLIWGCAILALAMLSRIKRRSVLDLWLRVVMFAWIFELGLSAVFNAGRFDLGFYAGRLYGLLASSFVLIMLLIQTLRLYAELTAAHGTLQDLARRDGLTGLFNRRAFDESLVGELQRASRSAQPVSLLLVDVDHFKQFNDRYGHLAGDACLKVVARAIGEAANRPTDMAARYGGEEFVVLLPSTDAAGALQVAERMRSAVALRSSACGQPVTISVGATTRLPGDAADSTSIIDIADHALYEAKEAGRDRVVMQSRDDTSAQRARPHPIVMRLALPPAAAVFTDSDRSTKSRSSGIEP